MALLDEIKKLKANRQQNRDVVRLGEVENPLPYWEKAFSESIVLVQGYCKEKGITFAELMDDCQHFSPASVKEYFQLSDDIDCDIFGRWCDGRLSDQELRSFHYLVDKWKQAVRNLLVLHDEKSTDFFESTNKNPMTSKQGSSHR